MSGKITILCGEIHKEKALKLFTDNSITESLYTRDMDSHCFKTSTFEHLRDFLNCSDEVFRELLYKQHYDINKLLVWENIPTICFRDPIFHSIHIPPIIKAKCIIEIAKKCKRSNQDFLIATNDEFVLDVLRTCVCWGIIDKTQLIIKYYQNDNDWIEINIDSKGTIDYCPHGFFDYTEKLLSILIFGKEDTIKNTPNNIYIKYLND
jgi:hypothetical protein